MKVKSNVEIKYYTDELNDEFSKAKIEPRVIDGSYRYERGKIWNFISYIMQNILSMPIKYFYAKLKFNYEVIGKEKFKSSKEGYFIYSNHTQEFADTFLTSLACFPKRNFFIVNPENISMKGMQNLVELLGAIPVPGNIDASKNFIRCVEKHIDKGHSITIFPEAHIWPYCTFIRNFKSVSFKYPVKFNKPIYTVTTTYKKYGKNNDKLKIISYVDGPFKVDDEELNDKQKQEKLRDIAYNKMLERSKLSDVKIIDYKYKEK